MISPQGLAKIKQQKFFSVSSLVPHSAYSWITILWLCLCHRLDFTCFAFCFVLMFMLMLTYKPGLNNLALQFTKTMHRVTAFRKKPEFFSGSALGSISLHSSKVYNLRKDTRGAQIQPQTVKFLNNS